MILLTGATGEIGPYVIEALHNLGYKIRTLSVDPLPVNVSANGIESRIGDVTNTSDVQSAMQGVEAVIHMAALRQTMNPKTEVAEKYKRVNVGGTKTVVDEAIKADVKRIVFFSTIHVYGDASNQIINELTTPQPDTLYAKTKLDGEKVVLSAKNNGQPIGVVLRLAAVYGPRVTGNYKQLLMVLAKNRFIPIGQGENRRTLIYVKDVANAAVLAMTHPSAGGQIFNVTDGKYHKMKEIISVMCDALGRAKPHISIPVSPVRLVAGIAEEIASFIGLQSPVTRAKIDKYTEDITADGQQIQSLLGFTPQYDLIAGWRETVQELKNMGDL